jgi:YidC/Oxa1 family membrane protein insertase
MNNKRSPIEQFLLIALLGFAAFTLSQQFFGNKNQKQGDQVAARVAPALNQAFDKLQNGSAPEQTAALAEIAALQKKIDANEKDDYAAWAHLRIGLLQQYALKNSKAAIKAYDVVINRHKNEAVDAQALYQKGDLLWRQAQAARDAIGSTPDDAPPAGSSVENSATAGSATANSASETSLSTAQIAQLETDAAYALEQLPVRGRGHKAFLDTKILVPDAASHRGDPLSVPQKWEEMTLLQLRGEPDSPATRSILSRVDEHYSKTPLYVIFDTVVKWFGSQPSYSYGLALLLLAVVTRTLMQPFIKKQYDSMKGMSAIAPEMKKIQEKYKGKNDPESQRAMMQQIRALQKAHGVNPMGCGLSMLIQMPVFFFFVLPLINHYQARLELVGAHFGWIPSLARPDIPLLVLYAVSMFISVRLSSVPPTDDQQKQMQKITTLMSPLFAIVLWSYPSAFILYWLAYNVVSMVFQWRMMKKAEPTKDLVKTLLGTGQPALAVAGAGSTPAATGALPSRPKADEDSKSHKPKTEKSKTEKSEKKTPDRKTGENESPFNTDVSALNATPGNAHSNGSAKNGASKNGASKNAASKSGSQRARRRRR